jgi:hypothetical protein
MQKSFSGYYRAPNSMTNTQSNPQPHCCSAAAPVLASAGSSSATAAKTAATAPTKNASGTNVLSNPSNASLRGDACRERVAATASRTVRRAKTRTTVKPPGKTAVLPTPSSAPTASASPNTSFATRSSAAVTAAMNLHTSAEEEPGGGCPSTVPCAAEMEDAGRARSPAQEEMVAEMARMKGIVLCVGVRLLKEGIYSY